MEKNTAIKTGTKQYTTCIGDAFYTTVQINHDVLTDEKLHGINSFWMDAEYRLSKHNGDVSLAVVERLAQRIFCIEASGYDAADEFNQHRVEGWPKLDGSEGLRLLICGDFDVSDFDFEFYSVCVCVRERERGRE